MHFYTYSFLFIFPRIITAPMKIKLIITPLFLFAFAGGLLGQTFTKWQHKKELYTLFEKGEYAEVLSRIPQIKNKKNAAMCSYFTGRVLLETDSTNTDCIKNLLSAAKKGYNRDVHFYLAQAYLKNGDLELSKISLANFKLVSNRRKERELQVSKWYVRIDSAYRSRPVEVVEDAIKSEINVEAEAEVVEEEVVVVDHGSEEIIEIEPIADTVSVKQAVPIADQELLTGLECQYYADSLSGLINELENKKLQTPYGDSRSELVKLIIRAQNQRDKFQYQANKLIHKNNALPPAEGERVEAVSKHEILSKSIEELMLEENKVPMGLVYQVQLGVFSRALSIEEFKGLGPVYYETIPDRGLYKYYLGVYYKVKDANKSVEIAKNKGFTGIFVVSYMDGKKIPIQKAREIEFSTLLD